VWNGTINLKDAARQVDIARIGKRSVTIRGPDVALKGKKKS